MTAENNHRIEPFWDSQLAIAVVIALYLALPERLSLGPRWAVPALCGALLATLAYATPWNSKQPPSHSRGRRNLAFVMLGLVSLANLAALARLIHDLIDGHGLGGRTLLGAAFVVWFSSVLIFGVWFWELDRGGPVVRSHKQEDADAMPDFFFQQMDPSVPSKPGWMPAFVDYLYMSFTNATAFSPTDVLPLSAKAKLLMLAQSLSAFVTVVLVGARAVNILH
jgi:hypothetical protein